MRGGSGQWLAFVGLPKEINCREGKSRRPGRSWLRGGEAQAEEVRDLIFGEFLKRKKAIVGEERKKTNGGFRNSGCARSRGRWGGRVIAAA